MFPPSPGTRLRSRAGPAVRAVLCAAAVAAASACETTPTTPDDLPFGRVGEVRIEVRTPLSRQRGQLQQILSWSSQGPWRTTERIFYQGELGDETVRRSTEDPGTLAGRYAHWIGLVNDSGPVQLFLGDRLPPALAPSCADPLSVVTIRMVDAEKGDSIAWSRCGTGSLGTLSSEDAGPDPAAGRVVEAARLARDATLAVSPRFEYAYTGSLPFRTIQRGEQSMASLLVPRVIEDRATWVGFWAQHSGGASAPPEVDFTSDLVLIGAIGTRHEAGDSVEVRRVLPVGFATQISLFERKPGNFCTPAPRTHAPYHIVVAPQVPRPIFFSVGEPDLVPCG